MRTSKRWTNVTFTHRVDHEAGMHRGPAAAKGPRICERCGAVYTKRRWTLAPTIRPRTGPQISVPDLTLCPACQMAAEGRFGGEVRLSGAFLSGHRGEIEQLIRNEARRASDDNPLGRIVRMDRTAAGFTVRTTTEHLAQRIGHALHKAFHGTVRYRFSHENKFAHVIWSRER
ncbi:MAG: BCAM0308 family protein [Acidobacteriota bacterium]